MTDHANIILELNTAAQYAHKLEHRTTGKLAAARIRAALDEFTKHPSLANMRELNAAMVRGFRTWITIQPTPDPAPPTSNTGELSAAIEALFERKAA